MHSRSWSTAALLALLFTPGGVFGDVGARRGVKAETTNWPYALSGVQVTGAALDQSHAAAVTDAMGGLIVVWQDFRNGTDWNIYAQRVAEDGTRYWLPADGVSVCLAAGDQTDPRVAPDGSGGVLITWKDRRSGNDDVYATRILGSGGAPASGWPVNGKPIANSIKDEQLPRIVTDDVGGAWLAWQLVFGPGDIDIWCAHVQGNSTFASGFPRFVSQGVTIEQNPDLAVDGFGGAFIAWEDARSGNGYDIFAQKILQSGTFVWPGGLLATSDRFTYEDAHHPTVVTDRAGGLWVALFMDNHFNCGPANMCPTSIRLKRILGFNGAVWVSKTLGFTSYTREFATAGPYLEEDGSQGCFVPYLETEVQAEHFNNQGVSYGRHQLPAYSSLMLNGSDVVTVWEVNPDYSGDTEGIRGQKLNASVTPWFADEGIDVAGAHSRSPAVVPDGAGGAFVVFEHSGNGVDLFVNRMDAFGRLGNAEPHITSIVDVPNDQGGQVRMSWSRSYLDSIPTLEVASYGVWRQVSSVTMAASLAAGGRLLGTGETDNDVRPGLFRVSLESAQTTYWEGVANVPARGQPSYVTTVPTLGDSTGYGIPFTVFRVDAHGAFAPGYWDSRPDSGYSADNVAPAVPTHLVFHKPASLTWDPAGERDFAYFTIYGSSSSTFGGGAIEIDQTIDTNLNVQLASHAFYFVTSTDAAGNEGSPAGVANTVGIPVPGELPQRFALLGNRPNPFRAETAIGFDLPTDGNVDLNVYDLLGHKVATLVASMLPAGRYTVVWAGKNERGERVSPGIYFYAYQSGSYRETRQLVLLR